jgi:hypothetical protein
MLQEPISKEEEKQEEQNHQISQCEFGSKSLLGEGISCFALLKLIFRVSFKVVGMWLEDCISSKS